MKSSLTKKYYVPGLISAVLVPIIFWYCGSQRIDKNIYTVIDLGLPAKYDKKVPLNEQIATFERVRNWKYQKIIVEPGKAMEYQKYYVEELKKLQKANRKESGIEFVIDDKNTYQDFISLLDAMSLAKQEAYGLDLDKTQHLFAVHFYQDSKEQEEDHILLCGTSFDFIEDKFITKSNYAQDFFANSNKLPKQAFYIIFGYLFLLNFSVLSLVRKSV